MKKKILSLIILTLFSITTVEAQKMLNSFNYLGWISLSDRPYSTYFFGYDRNGTTFHFDGIPQDFLSISDPRRMDSNYGGNGGSMNFYIGYFQQHDGAPIYHFFFSEGPSVDPTFYITDNDFNPLWSQFGQEMAVTEGGVIYLMGTINRMFNMKMKFKITSSGIREIPQPYYYVGVQGELLKPIKLYSQKEGGEVVATLPKGYAVEVLLADPRSVAEDEDSTTYNRYLVRSNFGLVGWMRLANEDLSSFDPVIRGVGFVGD